MNDTTHQSLSRIKKAMRVALGFALAVVSTPLTLLFAFILATGPHENMSSTQSFVSLIVVFACMCLGWKLVQKHKVHKCTTDGFVSQGENTSNIDTPTVAVTNDIEDKTPNEVHVVELERIAVLESETPTGSNSNQNFSALGGLAVLGVCFLGIMYFVNPSFVNSDSKRAKQIARGLIIKQLNSPSSFNLISENILWTGTDKSGYEASIVKVEYDAQNGFGAVLRACQWVSYSILGEEILLHQTLGIQTCPGVLATDEEFVEVIKENAFGIETATVATID